VIGIRHFLHPLRTARLICRSANVSVYRALHETQLENIRRTEVTQCWCGGPLHAFNWHPSYGTCGSCGTYVNLRPPVDEELQRIYSFDYYWHTRQKMRGNPTIENRPQNDRSDGRVDYWLQLIDRYHPRKGRVIEVGCGSGVLLRELQSRGYECIGVDVDEKSAAWVRGNMGLDVRTGVFPDVELPCCSLFLAFDVIEHTKRPHLFMRRAAELLTTGGIAVVQAPIDRSPEKKPFGRRFEDAFDDLEHLFLFTDKAMRDMAAYAGLDVVTLDETLWLMGELAVFRKP
jgi:SAM-dependent methyltransferase